MSIFIYIIINDIIYTQKDKKDMKYKIYRITNPDKTPYTFMGYDFAKSRGLKVKDYKIVYEGECEDEDPFKTLERLFVKFNTDRPSDFNGWSISVSDIVELDGIKYYCDLYGWKPLN